MMKSGTRLVLSAFDKFPHVLAHCDAQKGDVVCLLQGCITPIILRPSGETWSVIGEGFIPYVMKFHAGRDGIEEFQLQ